MDNKILFIIIIATFFLLYYYNNNNKNKKKIAFCFLIYDKINQEELWYEWFKGVDKNKYNIYIHYKENKYLKHFEKYKIRENIPTKYGDVSLIHAQNLLFNTALKDNNNYKFINLSQSCVPVKSFDYIYDFLTKDNLGHFNVAPMEQVFPRCNSLIEYYPKDKIKKSSQWFILNKEITKTVVNSDKENINKMYSKIFAPEEHYYITTIYNNNLENQINITDNLAYSTTYTGWTDMKDYISFKNKKLKKTTPHDYEEISNEELDYLVNSECLFARKFQENCDLKYLHQLLLN